MKIMIAGAAGVAVVLGLTFATVSDTALRREKEAQIRACQAIGVVASDCPALIPSIERCQHEDCSDIRGPRGYWTDPSTGRLYLQESPQLVIRPQGPS